MGLNGNVGRCFHRFQDFASCMVILMRSLKNIYSVNIKVLENF